jgi:lipopolysaccharide export system protein LptA
LHRPSGSDPDHAILARFGAGHPGCRIPMPSPLQTGSAGSPKVPWQISADTLNYDAASTTYHAKGNVVIEKQAARLVADTVSFNHKAMTAVADGHVVMTVGDDVLTGARVELNLDQETGVVHDGTVFLKENHFYIHGDRIEKTGKGHLPGGKRVHHQLRRGPAGLDHLRPKAQGHHRWIWHCLPMLCSGPGICRCCMCPTSCFRQRPDARPACSSGGGRFGPLGVLLGPTPFLGHQ